jgi:hypothetical protein
MSIHILIGGKVNQKDFMNCLKGITVGYMKNRINKNDDIPDVTGEIMCCYATAIRNMARGFSHTLKMDKFNEDKYIDELINLISKLIKNST